MKVILVPNGALSDQDLDRMRQEFTNAQEAGEAVHFTIDQCEGSDRLEKAYLFCRLIIESEIHTSVHVKGFASSAAFLIYLACEEKSMNDDASLSWHTVQVNVPIDYVEHEDHPDGLEPALEKRVSELRKGLFELLWSRTTLPKKLIELMMRHQGNLYFSKERANHFGMLGLWNLARKKA